jgi:hypothetical protein
MLCRKMVRHQGIVEYRYTHKALLAGPRKCRIGRQEEGKASDCHQQRHYDEPYRLITKEWPVRFCAVGKPRTAQSMADPEQRTQPEVKTIERA